LFAVGISSGRLELSRMALRYQAGGAIANDGLILED
jgi:hypothetical protein